MRGEKLAGRGARAFLVVFAGACALAVGCGDSKRDASEDGPEDGGESGTAGSAANGGGGSSSGSVSTGGVSGKEGTTGGTAGTSAGGSGAATGGTSSGGTSSGGRAGRGGAGAMGGAGRGGAGTGGAGSGGAGTGGAGAGAGGKAGGGGAGAGGGTAGAGGEGGGGVACESTFVVASDGFVRAPAVSGCWYGYAFAGGDNTSTLVTPTSFSMCGTPCLLRVSGTLGPATLETNYSGAVFVGFNLRQAAGSAIIGSVTPTGTSLVVTYTKAAGPSIVRVQIGAGASRWCANLGPSPATIPYSAFNSACWDDSGTAYAKQPIDTIQLVAPGTESAQPIDLTLVGVREL